MRFQPKTLIISRNGSVVHLEYPQNTIYTQIFIKGRVHMHCIEVYSCIYMTVYTCTYEHSNVIEICSKLIATRDCHHTKNFPKQLLHYKSYERSNLFVILVYSLFSLHTSDCSHTHVTNVHTITCTPCTHIHTNTFAHAHAHTHTHNHSPLFLLLAPRAMQTSCYSRYVAPPPTYNCLAVLSPPRNLSSLALMSSSHY